ncbi:hypothetical protein CVIRNUC_008260 [Coccomyxa viridis]|uniref:Peptidase S8/S53 domain-containing protein n=1 Tax=Coccomyxa viridis TaxID=1274662 RepID=A0AAV1IFN5_9CHLO|nr:hypothetical protein CVIRNUC_008260 [Coccomyxa viridis]
MAVSCRALPPPPSASFSTDYENKIIVFKDWQSLRQAWQICSGSAEPGLAGSFTADELGNLRRCFGDSVAYIEDDLTVQKAEVRRDVPQSMLRRLRGDEIESSPLIEQQAAESASPTSMVSQQLQSLERVLKQDAGSRSAAGFLPASFGSGVGEPAVKGIKQQTLPQALWNLDRIDKRSSALNSVYRYGTPHTLGTGKGVTIYTLDSGLRLTHQEFQAWDNSGSRGSYGWDFSDGNNDWNASDCDGHGTHVASVAAGRMVGVAKEARVVAVKVLGCDGSGTISSIIAGLDWLMLNHVAPAVATMSLGVPVGQWSRALDSAVTSLIDQAKVTVVVAAGNTKADSCTIAPGNVNGTLNMAASDLASKFMERPPAGVKDGLYPWSNTGRCVDMFAPGVDILAACGGAGKCPEVSDTAYAWASGTSMAVPHAAGMAAIYLSDHPSAEPREVIAALTAAANPSTIEAPDILSGTPLLMLNTDLYSAYESQQNVSAANGPEPAAG